MNNATADRHVTLLVAEYGYFLSHRLALARAAVRAGYAVTVITGPPAAAASLHEPGLRLVHVDMSRSSRSPLRDFRLVIRLARILRRLRPDIVHNVSLKMVVLGSLAAWLARVPVVINAFTGLGYVFNSTDAGARRLLRLVGPLLRHFARRPNVWSLVQNRDDGARLESMGLVDPGRLRLIEGSGVDIDEFSPASRDNQPPVVLFAGRLLLDKGIAEFVEAAAGIAARGIAARFQVAGTPDAQNPKSISARQLDLWRQAATIQWLGAVSDMPSLYRAVDIVCLPSHHEGLPKVLLEAAASGLPLVATDIAGCRPVVAPGVNGLLVPVNAPRALAEALEKLILNKELRVNMGIESRRLAERKFAVGAVNGQILRLYGESLVINKGVH